MWIERWKQFLQTDGKKVIPRFEHDEHQAFYDAQVFLREEKNNYEEIEELENEYRRDWEQHNKFEEEMEPEERKITAWKGSENKYSEEEIKSFIDWLDDEKKKNEIIEENHCDWIPDMLNKKQRFVYEIVKEHFDNNNNNQPNKEPLRLGFYGRPGTGKSVTIHCLKKLLGDQCRIGAVTGSASNNVNGQTLHSLLKISIGKNQRKFSNKELIELQEKWKKINYLIIDEISLVSLSMLNRIDQNLKLFKTNHNNGDFGSMLFNIYLLILVFAFFVLDVSIIIAGDFAQLPPVRAQPLYAELENNRSQEKSRGKELYRSFKNIIVFDQNKRQEHAQKHFQEGFFSLFLFFFFLLNE